MQWKPNVTVAAIIHHDDKFLLVEEDADNHIVYNQPAGHLENNETLIEAIKREVLEETAREFIPESIVGLYLYPNPHVDIVYLRVCFQGVCGRHFPDRHLDEGIIQTIWMSRAALEQNQDKLRSPMVLNCIDDYLNGNKYPLDILHHYINSN